MLSTYSAGERFMISVKLLQNMYTHNNVKYLLKTRKKKEKGRDKRKDRSGKKAQRSRKVRKGVESSRKEYKVAKCNVM